jgi:general secretion pathway protein A
MYKEYFNLKAEPFRITPDPGFLFLTDQHKEALSAIIYGIAKRKGFVCIIGEVGVGKTTILRSYLDCADEPGLRFVYIYNPNVSFQALLKHILKEIGLSHDGQDTAGMVETLRAALVAQHSRHETLVLLIDEAQNMPIGTLESLRMLSNLETDTEKLVQIVLVGQPELGQLLAERQLRQLESRIAVRTRLGPLSKADSIAYIHHRLKCVALDDKPTFTDQAIRLIVRRAGGIPRRINVLCDTALTTAFGRRVKPVSPAVVREVLRDLQIEAARAGNAPRPWRRSAAMAGGTLAAAALVAAALMLPPPPAVPEEPKAAMPPLTPAAMTVMLPPPEPPPAPIVAAPFPDLPAAFDPPPEPAAAEPPAMIRIAAPGDTLARLILDVYGRFDHQHLDWVKSHNRIADVDRIQVGQVIAFPPVPKEAPR